MNNLISVCIATYKRPELLEKLLLSLLAQKNIDDYNLEIIVVDNDPNKTAEAVVKRFSEIIISNPRCTVKYDMQPEKNIALTRNKTVDLATGGYLFFIDDDEYADENCLYHHLKVMNEFDADVTFGNVIPYFNEISTPSYIKFAQIYYKTNAEDGKATKYFFTSNTMLSLKKIKKEIINFNPDYGITGGSDYEFFLRITDESSKFLSAASSIVFEFIPPERSNLKWLVKRVFRTGNNYSRSQIENENNQLKRSLIKINQFIRGVIQSIISIILAIVFLSFDQKKSLNWFLKAVSNISKPFAVFGFYPKEYKK